MQSTLSSKTNTEIADKSLQNKKRVALFIHPKKICNLTEINAFTRFLLIVFSFHKKIKSILRLKAYTHALC